MAVRTQYIEVADIFPPIFYAARPRPYAADRTDLRARVDVVEIKQPDVINSAGYASPPERGNDVSLLFPIALLPSPVGRNALAFVAAIPIKARCLALRTMAGAPSGARIAAPGAVPCTFKPGPRWLDVELLRACDADAVMASRLPIRRKPAKALVPWVFHAAIIASRDALASYFDIACKRVEEAYRQGDMFVERPPAPKQEAFL